MDYAVVLNVWRRTNQGIVTRRAERAGGGEGSDAGIVGARNMFLLWATVY